MYQYPDYMYHHGVKGMKWGVRKQVAKAKERKAAKEASYSEEYKRFKTLKKKGYKNLSNQELKELNERMRLESEYKRLNPSKIKKGQKVVNATLAVAGTAASIYGLRNNPVVKLGIDVIKSRF